MSVIRLMKSATENLSLFSEEVLGYSLASRGRLSYVRDILFSFSSTRSVS